MTESPAALPDFPDLRSRHLAWRGLVLGVLAQAVVTIVISGPAFLIPLLRTKGFTLATAGTAAAATSIGLVFTLVAWGALADRYGERLALTSGLFLCGATTAVGTVLAQAGALSSPLPLIAMLVLSGAAGGSVNTATGRVVAGWFPRHRRGMAMGIRQMAQPLGTAVAAVAVPSLAAVWGLTGFFFLTAALCLGSGIACGLLVVDPPRPGRTDLTDADLPAEPAGSLTPASAAGSDSTSAPAWMPGHSNPYRADGFLVRIHIVSALLVVPQFTFATFGLVWLIDSQDMSAAAAGLLVGAAQLVGALGRFAMGGVSDIAPSRVVVLRWVAWSAAGLTGCVAAVSLGVSPVLAGGLFILASAASVADNGLALTSIAEASGSRWSGKAMGIQNTGQHIVASGVGPGIGALITFAGYPAALLCVAVIPVLASFIVPRHDVERD